MVMESLEKSAQNERNDLDGGVSTLEMHLEVIALPEPGGRRFW
jgi:hypothetical protein